MLADPGSFSVMTTLRYQGHPAYFWEFHVASRAVLVRSSRPVFWRWQENEFGVEPIVTALDSNKPIDILFLCTGNSCRSIMAQAMLRYLGGGRFAAHSAGSRPAGFIHPLAIHALTVMRIPLGRLESKSWNEFADRPVDVAITLCDSAAQESCPVFPGTKYKVHWSLPDPAFHLGDESERGDFAFLVAQRILAKIEGLIAIDWHAPSHEINKRLRFLGDI